MNRKPIDPSTLVDNARATFREWKRYETCVVAAMQQHPKPYVFSPTSLRPVTFTSRIRDAIRGCIAFNYPIISDTIITHDELAKWWSEVVVKYTPEHVFIGTPERVVRAIAGDVGFDAPLASTTLTFVTLSLEQIIAFTVLISGGCIPGPVLISSPPDVSLIPERPNVEMDLRADGKLLIL